MSIAVTSFDEVSIIGGGGGGEDLSLCHKIVVGP